MVSAGVTHHSDASPARDAGGGTADAGLAAGLVSAVVVAHRTERGTRMHCDSDEDRLSAAKLLAGLGSSRV